MHAIVIREPGGPEVLESRDVPAPEVSRGEVRVSVKATAVNRADLLQRMGVYPAPPGVPPNIPGLEVAGVVDRVGADVTELAVGDRVFGLVGGGGYAGWVVAHARTFARMPAGMKFTDAAAVPEAFITAWDAVVSQARLGAGDALLVHAAGSGVGTAGVQIAKALGARAIATMRSAAKRDRLTALGVAPDDVLVVEGGRFAEAVRGRTGGRGADVVLELVGGAYVTEDLECLAHRGRVVVVGTLGGARAELDLGLLMRKRAEVRGTMMRSRPLEEKIEAAQLLARRIAPLFESGDLRAVVDRVVPLEKAGAAHALMQSGETFWEDRARVSGTLAAARSPLLIFTRPKRAPRSFVRIHCRGGHEQCSGSSSVRSASSAWSKCSGTGEVGAATGTATAGAMPAGRAGTADTQEAAGVGAGSSAPSSSASTRRRGRKRRAWRPSSSCARTGRSSATRRAAVNAYEDLARAVAGGHIDDTTLDETFASSRSPCRPRSSASRSSRR